MLSMYLKTKAGEVVSRNFTTFDVRVKNARNITEVSPASAEAAGCERTWRAHGGEKLCLAGAGEIRVELPLPKTDINGLTLFFEASSKRFLKKDDVKFGAENNGLSFMRGARVDRGQFKNSYFMTDEDQYDEVAEVLVEGVPVRRIYLENDCADCRGILSFHNQPDDRKLDEAGSYGGLFRVEIPSRLIPGIVEKGSLSVTLRCGDKGIALYGRESGRYPAGIVLRTW